MEGHYGQLSLEERCTIARLHAAGQSCRQIAAALDRSASTISREMKRNRGAQVGYQPVYAADQAWARRWRGSRSLCSLDPTLCLPLDPSFQCLRVVLRGGVLPSSPAAGTPQDADLLLRCSRSLAEGRHRKRHRTAAPPPAQKGSPRSAHPAPDRRHHRPL